MTSYSKQLTTEIEKDTQNNLSTDIYGNDTTPNSTSPGKKHKYRSKVKAEIKQFEEKILKFLDSKLPHEKVAWKRILSGQKQRSKNDKDLLKFLNSKYNQYKEKVREINEAHGKREKEIHLIQLKHKETKERIAIEKIEEQKRQLIEEMNYNINAEEYLESTTELVKKGNELYEKLNKMEHEFKEFQGYFLPDIPFCSKGCCNEPEETTKQKITRESKVRAFEKIYAIKYKQMKKYSKELDEIRVQIKKLNMEFSEKNNGRDPPPLTLEFELTRKEFEFYPIDCR